ncbi:MAG: protein kinase domain-containing protein [Alphaproteobacteria bacterium]
MKYCPLCERTYGDEVTVCAIDGSILRESGIKQDPLIGKIVKARYRVLNKLGEGGMGTVYLAEQIAINRNVALKILHPDYANDPEFVKRFRQEARLAASLSHHNIVTIFDFDQGDDGSLYIVMEYVAGTSLSTVIKNGLLDVPTAVRLAIQIAEGLRAAHAAGVIHRDIKPENIMVLPGDEIKLMDFGIARLSNVEGATRLTRSGMIVGTPTYMAPEQIEGGEVGEATDIYAFGVLLYEMLSGHVPFSAPTPGAVLIKHLTETALPLRKLRNDVPAALEKIVKQALEKEPGRRQRSMGEVVDLLAKAQSVTAAERKSILASVGSLFKSAFMRSAEAKRSAREKTARQEPEIERPLETGLGETRLSPGQPSVSSEPESPTIESSTVTPPGAGVRADATVDFEVAPAPVAAAAEAEAIELTETRPQIHSTEIDARPVTPSSTVIDSAPAETEAVGLTPIQSPIRYAEVDARPAAAPSTVIDSAPAQSGAIGLTRPSEMRSPDAGAGHATASNTVMEAPSGATLVETIATTATTPVRQRRAATGLYTGLSAAAVVLLTALGFFLYHRQSNEPESPRLAQSTTEAPAPAVTNEPTEPAGQNLPAKVESPPRETGQDLQIKPEISKTGKNPEPPQREKKATAEPPAAPNPRPAAEVKAKSTKVPEVKPAPAKERTEIAKRAPVPETPPVKKVTPEPIKAAETPKASDVPKYKEPEPVKKAPEPVKKEPETKVASIDKTALKPPEAPPPPPPENRLVSLAIISAKRNINVKERVLLTVKGKYSNGNENEILAGVRFESSDASIAAVNSRGEVEGKKEGKADVIARYAGVVSGVYTFYVKGPPEKPKDQSGETLQEDRRRLLR